MNPGSLMRRILFIASTRIGDAVLSTGLINWLHERHPEARFTVACGPQPAPLFAEMPFVERVIPIIKRKRAGHWWDLWRATAPHLWSLVVDLRGSALAYVLPTLRRRVLRGGWAPEHRLSHLAHLFALPQPPAPKLWVGEASAKRALELIPPGPPVLGIGPTANWGGKTWPAQSFAQAIARLTAEDGPCPGFRIALFGAPNERDVALPVIDSVPEAQRLDLAGKLDIATTAACLQRLSFYVGNDSGLMHMAAALGIPTLGLFGPSSEIFYAPWGAHCASVRGPRSFEEICHAPDYDYRSHQSLMIDLSVDRVIEAARELAARVGQTG